MNVPGLSGYIAAQQQNQQQQLQQAQMAQAVMGLQGAMQKQAQQQKAQAELAALGQAPSEDALQQWAARHAGPDATLKALTSSRDRQATLDAQIVQAQERRDTILEAGRERNAAMIEAARERGATAEALKQMQIEADERLRQMDIRSRRYLAQLAQGSKRPVLTEIVDPLKPDQMLKIDVLAFDEAKYRAGDRTGVFGVSGKEPSAAKREEREGQGKDLLRTELDNLREHYRVLDEARAIPSDKRGGVSNATSWVQGSAAGQLGGRILGTKEQTARNQIQSARLRIMNAIKNATGMSAQQLNSNVELKTWLDSLTSMTGSYESNVGIIDALDKAFLKGGAGGGGPKVGDVMDGYEFLGGNPSDQKSWRKK